MLSNTDINSAVRETLLARLGLEEIRAKEKQANRDYWRNVGDIEMEAARTVRKCVLEVADTLAPEKYLAAMSFALQDLALSWRENDWDEDGYGVATVHAVGRELPKY